jgi:hypothetical protein
MVPNSTLPAESNNLLLIAGPQTMSDELLYGQSEWLIAAVMIALLFGAAELGYRFGLKRPTSFNDVGCGLGKHRHTATTNILAILLIVVMTVIMDLDRPRRGLIQVSQNSMIRLHDSMSKETP